MCRTIACVLVFVGAVSVSRAQPVPLAAVPAGVVETGTPAFVVLGPEALGLSSPPTDLQRLPDGRILAFARTEFAIGDGLRWETVRRAAGEEEVDVQTVAVDAQGRIYTGIRLGIARVVAGEDGFWHFELAAKLPAAAIGRHQLLTQVSVVDGQWFWHAGSGVVAAWRPDGGPPTMVGTMQAVDCMFGAFGKVFASSRADGSLLQIGAQGFEPVILASEASPNQSIACSAPLDDRFVLIGTSRDGLKLFDGSVVRPLVARGLLAGGRRINDICPTVPGLYAAAVDTLGVVFFDRNGRIVQVLDRTMDNRLARAQRVLYAAGSVWVLLQEGVARVQFPSRISNFESFISTGVTYVQPYRHEGQLWLAADGMAQRGVYDEGRLARFENDSPPGEFVYSLCTMLGPLVATNDRGIWVRKAGRWELALEGVVNARMEIPSHDGLRWLYTARGEYGWLIVSADGQFSTQPLAAPALSDIYGIELETDGDIWLEFGTGRAGRMRVEGDRPHLEFFDEQHGIPEGWVQVFVVDGIARFNIANHIYRFDDATRRFVEDAELLARLPDVGLAVGRPKIDTRGRLWLTARGAVQVLDRSGGDPGRKVEVITPGIQPYLLFMEDNGVVWMHETRKFVRFDSSFPVPPEIPLRAIITRVTFTKEDRSLFAAPAEIPRLAYSNNSLSVHFAAPDAPISQPVTFEVMLEGSAPGWTSAGASGAAVFNELPEGAYVLRVRPRAGTNVGAEAEFAFVVRPPWYRTTAAYIGYVFALGLTVLVVARMLAYLDRREKARLERVVATRTAELRGSEERYRRLNEELEQRVEQRTAELHQANDSLVASNRELEAFSYSVSHDLRSPLRNISGFADRVRKRESVQSDREADRFLGIIGSESVRLGKLIDSLLSFSRFNRAAVNTDRLNMDTLVRAVAEELHADAGDRFVEWRIHPLPEALGDATLIRQVYANLLGNALKFTRDRVPAIITVGAQPAAGRDGRNEYFVRDNGVGFDLAHVAKLFGVFQRLHDAREFEGAGIGLAIVERIVARHGGRVWAEGKPGEGATFFFTLSAAAPVPRAT